MKAIKRVIISVLIVGLTICAIAEEVKRPAKIIDLKGTVQVKTKTDGKLVSAEVGMLLNEGDVISTAKDSHAVINLDGKGQTATMEISENSSLTLSQLIENRTEKTQKTFLDLAIGKVLIQAKKLDSPKSKFEVKTPTSVVGVRGTKFSVEVEAVR